MESSIFIDFIREEGTTCFIPERPPIFDDDVNEFFSPSNGVHNEVRSHAASDAPMETNYNPCPVLGSIEEETIRSESNSIMIKRKTQALEDLLQYTTAKPSVTDVIFSSSRMKQSSSSLSKLLHNVRKMLPFLTVGVCTPEILKEGINCWLSAPHSNFYVLSKVQVSLLHFNAISYMLSLQIEELYLGLTCVLWNDELKCSQYFGGLEHLCEIVFEMSKRTSIFEMFLLRISKWKIFKSGKLSRITSCCPDSAEFIWSYGIKRIDKTCVNLFTMLTAGSLRHNHRDSAHSQPCAMITEPLYSSINLGTLTCNIIMCFHLGLRMREYNTVIQRGPCYNGLQSEISSWIEVGHLSSIESCFRFGLLVECVNESCMEPSETIKQGVINSTRSRLKEFTSVPISATFLLGQLAEAFVTLQIAHALKEVCGCLAPCQNSSFNSSNSITLSFDPGGVINALWRRDQDKLDEWFHLQDGLRAPHLKHRVVHYIKQRHVTLIFDPGGKIGKCIN